MSANLEILLIVTFISVACSLCGTFLVLRKMSMQSDSITHTILLGIVLAFFVVSDLNSPFLIIGAAAMGVFTVWLTESLCKTKLLSNESAIGLVFPLLFSVAVILIAKYAGSVHLDTDSVLLGEPAFAPFNRLVLFGIDFGAKAVYSSAFFLILNIAFILIFYKELKISTFDPTLALLLGFSPTLIFYSLMSIVSLTAVASFEAVGSILVVAFMICPPATAFLLTEKLKSMLILSAVFAATSAVLGFATAILLDVSIAGSVAVFSGIIFAVTFAISRRKAYNR